MQQACPEVALQGARAERDAVKNYLREGVIR
jgi:hypothetical protein